MFLKKIQMVVAALILLGCSRKAVPLPITESVSSEIQAQINRIEPALLWCDGGFAFPRPNNEDGRPNCDVGDGLHYTGILLSAKSWQNTKMVESIQGSVAASGQTFRAASYLKANDPLDASSRDQWVGFLHYLIATKDMATAKRAIDYIKSHNDKLCPNASDNKCEMTIEIKALTDDVYKSVGFSRVYNVNRWLVEQSTIVEAKSVPVGYQTHLVAQKVYLIALSGNLTGNYATAIAELTKRQPNNLFIQYVYTLTHGNDINRYNQIASSLLGCMQRWNNPGGTWTYSNNRNASPCEVDASGHDYVWLAKLLLSKSPSIEIHPNALSTDFSE